MKRQTAGWQVVETAWIYFNVCQFRLRRYVVTCCTVTENAEVVTLLAETSQVVTGYYLDLIFRKLVAWNYVIHYTGCYLVWTYHIGTVLFQLLGLNLWTWYFDNEGSYTFTYRYRYISLKVPKGYSHLWIARLALNYSNLLQPDITFVHRV